MLNIRRERRKTNKS